MPHSTLKVCPRSFPVQSSWNLVSTSIQHTPRRWPLHGPFPDDDSFASERDAVPSEDHVSTFVFNSHHSLNLQAQRDRLPIRNYRDQILYCLENHQTLVLVSFLHWFILFSHVLNCLLCLYFSTEKRAVGRVLKCRRWAILIALITQLNPWTFVIAFGNGLGQFWLLVNHRNSFSIDINYLHWDTIPINQLMDSLVVHILREITSPRSATVRCISQSTQ